MVVCDRLSLVSIIMMATIAGMAEKEKFNNHNYGNHSPAIAATMIAEIVVATIAGEWLNVRIAYSETSI